MKTIEVKLFEFSELSSEVQQKVLEKQRHINVEHNEWYEFTTDAWKEKLNKLGFLDAKIAFSGFWSQGDGASFTGRVDVLEWIKNNNTQKYRRLMKLFENNFIEQGSSEIKRDRWGNYVHWNTTSLFLDFQMYGNKGTDATNVANLLEELEQEIFSQHQDLNKEIYSDLEKEYEELTSDESVKETIESNEYTFEENGRMNNG